MGKSSENMGKFSKVWGNMGKSSENMVKYREIWGKSWENPRTKNDEIVIFDGHVRFTGHIMELT